MTKLSHVFFIFLWFDIQLGVLGNTIEALGTAGQILAKSPFQHENLSNNPDTFAIPEEQPNYFDLAVSRLYSKVDEVIDGLWDALEDKRKLLVLSQNGVSKGVLESFGLIKSDIFALEQHLERARFEYTLKNLQVPHNDKKEWLELQDRFSKILGKIIFHFNTLDSFMNNAETTKQLELEDYARSIIQPGSSQATAMLTTLDDLNSLAIPSQHDKQGNRTDIMFKILNYFQDSNGPLCELNQSPSQFLLNLYNLIALTEIKGYMMVQFSYIVFKMYGHDSLTMEVDITRRKFKTNSAYKISFAREILESSTNDYWRCDSANPKEGSTFVRLTKLLQGHLENEVDMNSLKSCRDNCAAYKVGEPMGCYRSMFCAKQNPCRGRLYDCQFFHADAWVCMSQNPDRKYDWIEYENGIELGPQGQCINKVKVDSWWRGFFHCSYCLCLCDSPGEESDRFWSLQPQVSDIEQNKVVTGVRFVKKNRVIHLEIEQASAFKEGNIDPETREWLQAPIIDVTNSTQEELGYFKTMKYEERALDLDILTAPVGYVITGVRLRNLGGHINLEARITPIRFTSGQLIIERTVWIGNDNTPATLNVREELAIQDPDVPTKFKGMSLRSSASNQYILFGATSAKKDVSQTTIPYIDSQPVAPYVGSWLSGIGLYYKGTRGYGGYIGLTTSTYDISRHLVPKKLNNEEAYSILQ